MAAHTISNFILNSEIYIYYSYYIKVCVFFSIVNCIILKLGGLETSNQLPKQSILPYA